LKARVAALAQRVKATRRLPGVEEILIPGERGNQVLQQALERGAIEVEDSLWQGLQAAAGVI
jgi:LDH2 family malate/lactate/ureidoglycolate dehydrogenase